MTDKGLSNQHEKIIEWINEGLTQEEIAQKLEVSQTAINYHVKKLRAEGKLPKSKKTRNNSEEREKRYEQIIQWYNEGLSQREMAQRLGITKSVVARYIDILAKEGIVKEWSETESEKLEQQLEKTIWLYNRGTSNDEIAKILGVSNSTVGNYISKLKAEGRIPQKKPESIQRREMYDKIVELYYKGFTQEEMAKELGKSKEYINSCIVKLRKKGLLKESRPVSIKEKRLLTEIVILYEEGKTTEEISERLKISTSAIENRIAKLKAEGRIIGKLELNRQKRSELLEKIRLLYNAGHTTEKISKDLGIPPNSVQSYISALRRQGVLVYKVKIKSKRLEERYKLIIKLYNDGVSISEMARKIGVSEGTIRRNIATLRNQNKLPKLAPRKVITKSDSKEREEEYRQIIDLYNQYLSIKEISKRTGLSSATVSRYISIMIEEGSLKARNKKRVKTKAKKAKEEEIKARQEKIIEWYNEGITIEEMAKKLGVNRVTVSRYVSELIKRGKISSTSPRVEERQKETLRKKETLIEMYSKGATADEIAQELGLTRNTVYGYIQKLRKQGLIPPAERKKKAENLDGKERKKDQYIRLYMEGKTAKEMAEIMGVAIGTVYSNISALRKEGVITPATKRKKKQKKKMSKAKSSKAKPTNYTPSKETTMQERILQLYDQGHTKSEISEILQMPYDRVEEALKDRIKKRPQLANKPKEVKQLTRKEQYSDEDLYQIRQAIKKHGYPDNEVRFLIDQYIKRKMYWECINFLNAYLEDKTLSKEKRSALEKIKKQLIQLKNESLKRNRRTHSQER